MRKYIFIISLFLSLSVFPYLFAEENDGSLSPLSLSLESVSELALKNNIDIMLAKLDAYIVSFDLDKENSLFDTYINMLASYRDDQRRPPTTILGSRSLEHDYSLSLEKLFPTGTTVAVEGAHSRGFTDSAFSSINPAIEATATVSLSQSLGKNFFGLIDRLNVEITKLDIESAGWISLDSIEASLAETQKAYWKLVLAEEELEIKKDMQKEAEGLYDVYQQKAELGLTEDPDIFASEANVLLRDSDVSVAELARETAKNNLLFILNQEDTTIEIKPQDKLDIKTEGVDLYSQLTTAINTRRDYKIAKNSVSSQEMDVKVKKNSLWPEIDLAASYTRNGLSSRYKNSWGQITNDDYPEVFVGITVSMPLENRYAKADFEQAKLSKEKALLTLKRVERSILRELNNQVTSVNTYAQQAEIYRKASELQDKKLSAEKKRFASGRSNSDILIRYAEDLLEAQLRLVRSLYAYRASLIELETKKNTLLDLYWKDKL
jgi:outer membrane protein TolC